MYFSIDVAQHIETAVAFLQVRDPEKKVGCLRLDVRRLRLDACAALTAHKEPCAATYDDEESYSPRPLGFDIL